MTPLMADLEIMRLQVETLFCHDERGRLRSVNEPGKPPAARFFLGRTRHGNLCRFRHDLPVDVIETLESLAATEPVVSDLRGDPHSLRAYQDVLESHGPVQGAYSGPAYRFTHPPDPPSDVVRITDDNTVLLEPGFPYLVERLDTIYPCVAVVRDDIAVSVCYSSRSSPRAAEAGVNTLEEFRGRGCAAAVAAGWALAVYESGRVPLYSTSWDNAASQGVARKLGLVMYGVDLHIT